MGMGAGWYSSWSTFSHGPAQIQKQKGRQAAKTKKKQKVVWPYGGDTRQDY
jgi:hypothetical protein